jgi:hypothetical protein
VPLPLLRRARGLLPPRGQSDRPARAVRARPSRAGAASFRRRLSTGLRLARILESVRADLERGLCYLRRAMTISPILDLRGGRAAAGSVAQRAIEAPDRRSSNGTTTRCIASSPTRRPQKRATSCRRPSRRAFPGAIGSASPPTCAGLGRRRDARSRHPHGGGPRRLGRPRPREPLKKIAGARNQVRSSPDGRVENPT